MDYGDSVNEAAQEFLEDLEERHEAVLQQLDQLNARIESVLASFGKGVASTSHEVESPSMAVEQTP